MGPSLPFWVSGSFRTLFDFLGNGAFIAASIWITEGFQLQLWGKALGVIISLWCWDKLYNMMRDSFSDSLERRSR